MIDFLTYTLSAIAWVCWFNPASLGRWIAKVEISRRKALEAAK